MSVLFFLFALVGWVYLYSRVRRAEDSLTQNQYDRNRDAETIAELTRRVWALEKSQQTPVVEATVTATILEPAPIPLPPPIVFEPPSIVVPPLAPPEPERLPTIAIPELFREPIPAQPSWLEQLRASLGGQEWEAVVGGNWLNKLGVLVLVIGIALLLGYEFTRVGAHGRVVTGIGVGAAMLISGVFVERKPGYEIFARGLIGGGWAALYFTTYAMHALPAAHVIDDPYVASVLLLAVAGGMILHSLRYRSQTVSGLAYFIAFATLALSESTPFSVLALLPLAASLLYLAHRFEWHRMAVFGLFATYATCASKPDAGAPIASTQTLFAAYWLLFETFDLFRLRRSTAAWSVESCILPINALGFVGLSMVKWQRSDPGDLYAFFAVGAALYLASALLRSGLRPPSSFEQSAGTLERIGGGSYEGPITIAAALAAVAIVLGGTGEWINAGLLMEGEALFVAGLLLGQKHLRRLAGAVFVGSLIKLLLPDQAEPGSIMLAGRSWLNWSPIAALSAATFYVNRMLRVSEGALYSTAAAGLIGMLLGYETPHQYLCVAWLGFAALLFETGFRWRLPEFRYQAYILGAMGTGAAFLVNFADRLAWLPLAICAALHYAVALRISLSNDQRLDDVEKNVSWISAASATAFLFVVAWKFAPGNYLGVAWLLLGAVLFELGLRRLPKHFRWLSYFVSAAGIWNTLWDFSGAVPLALSAAICCSLSARVFRPSPGRIEDWERGWCRDLYAGAGALFGLMLAWLQLSPPLIPLAWTVIGLALFELGIRFSLTRFRLMAHLIAATVCVRLFLFDFSGLGDALHITIQSAIILPIIALHYYFWWRDRRKLSSLYLYTAAILFVFLARLELGSTLAVVAWSLFGLAIFAIGRLRNMADLRWQSYAIALLSFFFTAGMLPGDRERLAAESVAIASLYCAQLLAARNGEDGVERYARAFYSLLAALLLAILLYRQVAGSTLTMAWSAEALALLGAGFPLRDRVQRLSGLALFMICVLKLFLYDLRELETVSRILSFIVLGLILVGVSWMYTRFRDRIQRYL